MIYFGTTSDTFCSLQLVSTNIKENVTSIERKYHHDKVWKMILWKW